MGSIASLPLVMMRYALLALLVGVGACHRSDSPPIPTSEQADQLNEAENLLDEAATNDAQSNTAR
jgi:hypothetical protein